MKLKSQKGSITIFVLVALLFYTAFLLLMYAANTNKLIAIKEKSDILKGIYGKNTDSSSISDIYNRNGVEYDYSADRIVFDGTNYINTGIKLFSTENINKDFEISFNINQIGNNENLNTLLNAKDETSTPYPGLCLRYSENSDMVLTCNSSSNNSYKAKYIENNVINKVLIKRIGNILYYSFNDVNDQGLIDFFDISNTFDTPLTFGASIDGSNSPFRYFKGEISDVRVKLYETNMKQYHITRTNKSFTLDGQIIFDGKNYIDTGLYLFSSSTKNKDFEISFDIVNLGDNVNQSTIFNSLDENWSPWPGLVLRYKNQDIELKGNSSDGNKQSRILNIGNNSKITVKRVSGQLYYKIDNGTETQLINYSDLARSVYAQLTFGSSLDADLKAFRFFKGTLANISVQISD